jgi:hypothetical protein
MSHSGSKGGGVEWEQLRKNCGEKMKPEFSSSITMEGH